MRTITPSIPRWRTALLGISTAAILASVFRATHTSLRDITSLSPLPLGVAIGVTLLFPLLSALRWYAILRGMNIAERFQTVLRIVSGTWILGILPGRLGDFFRIGGISPSIPRSLAIGSILFEKVLDIIILLGLITIGSILIGNTTVALITLGAACAACVLVWHSSTIVRTISPRAIEQRLELARQGITLLMRQPLWLARAGVASAINWLLSIAQVYALFQAAGNTVPFAAILARLPLSIFVGLVPITLGGMGTRDAAMIQLFLPWSAASDTTVVALWYSFLGLWLLSLTSIPSLIALLREKNSGQ